jgi:sigma-B regulation protein RsbU (phosphoserine phosphatase)
VSSSKRMRHIIHSIIDYTHAQREGIPIVVRDSADFHGVCERVLQEYRVVYPDREIVYEADGDPLGTWDEGRLEQVVQNLLGNALKYGAPEAPVSLRWFREGDDADSELVVTVHNGGKPIPPDLLPHIFEPFRLGDQARGSDARSMGLGLFIVREIVRAHGGEVLAASHEESGTTMTVRLPGRSPQPRRG